MYSYEWDLETGGYLLNSSQLQFSKEPRPVYYKELDILGFDKYWNYEKKDDLPFMWAESNKYFYRGKLVAKTKGGSLYTAPEIIIIEEPEPNEGKLKFVDIDSMIDKNNNILESLVQETIRKVYNTYIEYKSKIDVFYVAFSGGKDSIVLLDIVQRVLPHNSFKVVFGDTDMEFPTTNEIIENARIDCLKKEIEFVETRSIFDSKKSWEIFGPPARRLRWCCSVHKTAPIINRLRNNMNKVSNNKKFQAMMITGVRADESSSRADYDELSVGKKITGQYSFHPILDWNSAEIFLYIYSNKKKLNFAYKLGFNRVGCIMCPNSSGKHEYLKKKAFPKHVEKYCTLIVNTSKKDLTEDNKKKFLETGGWKMRISGRELNIGKELIVYTEKKDYHTFEILKCNDNWKKWYKTMGELIIVNDNKYSLEYNNIYRELLIEKKDSKTIFRIVNQGKTKNSIEFLSLFKSLLIKTVYCINCGVCEAECILGNIKMNDGELKISDNCTKCKACLKILNGCTYYNSIKGSGGLKNMVGINRYLSVGVSGEWIKNFFKNNGYEPGNRKTDSMFTFLNDSGVTNKRKITEFFYIIDKIGIENDISWALMLCNLVYTPAFNWYIKNIPFDNIYIEENLKLDVNNENIKEKAIGEFWNGFKVILSTTPYGGNLVLGIPDITFKTLSSGDVRSKMNSILRKSWQNPEPLVILYSLYKFAEACGDYYQFTLSRLLNHEIDSDGVSPTQIFGISRETMEQLLNGLAINYPDFISVSFTLDLDNITLRSEKSSKDVLDLF